MPKYNLTGITASLMVAELAGTLCDDIQLRMGSDQREEAERIKHQLRNGRTLPERPVGQNQSMVGVLQFVGDERDMALLVAETGEHVYNEPGDHPLTNLETLSVIANTSIAQSLGDAIPTSKEEAALSRKKKNGNIKRSNSHNQTALTTPTPKSKQPQPRVVTFDKPLALSLKVEYAEFIHREDMRGKDLKIEVFLNGQLVDITFESLRHTKARGGPLYSGKRFHRQAEKPWIYVPGTGSSNTGGLATERWANISQDLKLEASQRGTNQSGQRPISAQFLIALARLQLPDSIGARSENFAVIDVIITAGKGRKHGADTSYITTPTRLFDGSFSGFAPIEEDIGQHADPNGYLAMQDAFTRMPFGNPGSSSRQPSAFMDAQYPTYPEHQMLPPSPPNFLDTHTQPSAFIDAQYSLYPERQMLPLPRPSPHTPKPEYKSAETYRELLEGTPLSKRLSKYENAHGHIKGRRTLKQRLGDIVKMSPKKRIEVMNELKNELDEKTLDTIKRAFKIDWLDPTTPTNKKVQFSPEVFDQSPLADEDNAEIFFGQYIDAGDMDDPNDGITNALPPPQPQFLQDSSPIPNMPYFFPAPTAYMQFSPTQRLVPPEQTIFASKQQMMMPPSPAEWFAPPQQTPMQPSPAQEYVPPTTPLKISTASALSNSAMHVPVKKWASQMKREREVFAEGDEPPPPRPLSGASTTPQAQRVGKRSQRTSSAWLPKEQKYEEVLRDFQIPDLCVGSAVSYADGLQQRQVPKARSGDFREEEHVVGMRFIVL